MSCRLFCVRIEDDTDRVEVVDAECHQPLQPIDAMLG